MSQLYGRAASTETVSLRQCYACSAELHDHDKFCRRCGVRQDKSYVTSPTQAHLAECETRPLQSDEVYQSFSGRLIQIVAQSLPANGGVLGGSRMLRRLVCTLIAFPIWMLIVMLSPLDAYSAARAASGCVSER